jgi:hypothetical protein
MRKTHLNSYTKNTEDIDCDDEYEAEKLMWILSPNREQHRLKHVTTISDKELIIVLDDDSSHSIMMSDKESATRLQKTVYMILYEGRNPVSILAHRNTVHIDMG